MLIIIISDSKIKHFFFFFHCRNHFMPIIYHIYLLISLSCYLLHHVRTTHIIFSVDLLILWLTTLKCNLSKNGWNEFRKLNNKFKYLSMNRSGIPHLVVFCANFIKWEEKKKQQSLECSVSMNKKFGCNNLICNIYKMNLKNDEKHFFWKQKHIRSMGKLANISTVRLLVLAFNWEYVCQLPVGQC